jgi:FKBP-type peptidyl-prolyl cis-trans isomerase
MKFMNGSRGLRRICRNAMFAWICAGMLMFGTASCGDDEVTTDENWQSANEKAFAEIAGNPGYTELVSPGNNGSLYYRVLKQGDGEKPIYYTSQVQVYYKGWFVANSETYGITKGKVFDQKLFDNGSPATFAVSAAGSTYDSYYGTYTPSFPIEGWTIALQYMKKGDIWEIWIPSHLAYGTTGQSGSIPANTVLAFELEVVKVLGVDGDLE